MRPVISAYQVHGTHCYHSYVYDQVKNRLNKVNVYNKVKRCDVL